MTRKLIMLVVILFAAAAFADNIRPVPVNPAPGGEESLQTILDHIYGCTGCVNATTDQSTASLWYIPGVPPQVSAPLLQARFAAAGNSVGIYTNGNLVDIFTPAALEDQAALLQFNADGTITIGALAGCGTAVNCGTFSGINPNMFGFYLNNGSTNFFTEDIRNGGVARALAFDGPVGRWSFAFEDGTDFDYNDRVISVESIGAVPEPSTLAMLGVGIAFCTRTLFRRKSN